MRKALMIVTAAASIATATVAAPSSAEARCYGCWAGAGIAVGAIAGAAFASAAYGNYGVPYGGYYRSAYYGGYQPAYYGGYYQPAYYGGYYRPYYAPRYVGYRGCPRYYPA